MQAPIHRMTLTVRDVLRLDVLAAGRPEVVAGQGQLHRPVRWVHIADIRDVAPLLKGGELLLTSGLGVGVEPEGQREWVDQLAGRGVAGIILSLGWAYPEPPPAAVAEAERSGLPFIVLHQPVPFVEVTERLHSLIVDRQVTLLRKAEEMGRAFTELVLHGSPIRDIVDSLARVVSNPVVLESRTGHVVEFADYPGGDADVLATWAEHAGTGHAEAGPFQIAIEEGRPGCAWTPIPLRDDAWGRLHVVLFGPFDEIDRLALDRAAIAIALVLVSEPDESRIADQVEAALLTEARDHDPPSREEMVRRVTAVGRSLEGRRLVALVADGDDFAGLVARERMTEAAVQQVKAVMLEATRRAIGVAGATCVAAVESDEVLALLGLPDGADLRSVCDGIGSRIAAALERAAPGLTVTIGVGAEVPDTGGVARSFREAHDAVFYGKTAGRRGPAVHHVADLGLDTLMLALPDRDALARFVDRELGPVVELDGRSGAQLLPTLRALLEQGGNKAAAARALGVDRRSLYHRLDRISKLLRCDLNTTECLTRLSVAMRGLAIMERAAAARSDR